MKSFNIIITAVILVFISLFAGVNILMLSNNSNDSREYAVQIERLSSQIENNENYSLSDYPLITNVEKCRNIEDTDFFEGDNSCYAIKMINNTYYRFDYKFDSNTISLITIILIDSCLAVLFIVILITLLFIKLQILNPFFKLRDVPYELSKGNLTVPLKENKSRLFGKFVWGLDLLREHLEQQKSNELALQKDKKTLILSISHDIKTPLSAIKLSSQALSKGLYTDKEKQIEVIRNINENANRIENFVTDIIKASNEEFIKFEVNNCEFYLDDCINKITDYYSEKLSLNKTAFTVSAHSNHIIKGDPDRAVEVMQNIIENAIKYGNGEYIKIDFSVEEGCSLISISNNGCTIDDSEMPHIFDSFWRGSNSRKAVGSGLGLYICRQLMHLMNGEIFAEKHGSVITLTLVFKKV